MDSASRAYLALTPLLKGQIISRCFNLIHKTLIRPVILYGEKAWTLSEDISQPLRAFERRILGRIYGGVHRNGYWKFRYNHELQTLYEDVDIVTFIRVRRSSWIGRMNRMDDTRNDKQIFSSEPEGVRTREGPRSSWWECVWTDIKWEK